MGKVRRDGLGFRAPGFGFRGPVAASKIWAALSPAGDRPSP